MARNGNSEHGTAGAVGFALAKTGAAIIGATQVSQGCPTVSYSNVPCLDIIQHLSIN